MKAFRLCIALITLSVGSLCAGALDGWLLAQVRKDEQLLAAALSQTDGHSLELLRYSRTYIPFFLEPPTNFDFQSPGQKAEFDLWLGRKNSERFLPGGYIYRLRFEDAPPLYATSSGDWDGFSWHDIDLGRSLKVSPFSVWNGSESNARLATMIAGAPPRLLVYGQDGEIKSEEIFDAHAANLEDQVMAAEQPFKQNGAAALEMLSLAEYLENPDALWRRVDLSGRFNLRNQNQRDAEREKLILGPHLTRNATIEALRSEPRRRETQRPGSVPVRQSPELIKPSAVTPAPAEKFLPSTRWLVVAGGIVVVIGLVWLLLKKQKGCDT